jgi:diguanylate cyclase (GGDEF)-like protein
MKMPLKTRENQFTFDLSETWGRWTVLLVSLILIGAVDYLDYVTGPEVKLSVLFLGPVYFVTWNLGFRFGVFLSFLSALGVFIDPFFFPSYFPKTSLILWDFIVVLIFFTAFCFVLSRLKDELVHEREQARTDGLTGLLNGGAFIENIERERMRAIRSGRPYALCYMDLDNFKEVNDTQGHQAGSELLKMMAVVLRENMRKSDMVARIGGDEFVAFFPETSPKAAEAICLKLHGILVRFFRKQGLKVTLSIGLVTYRKTTHSVQESLHYADQLMYKAKRAGKNRIVSEHLGSASGWNIR